MAQQLTVVERARPTTTRHLIHRPRSAVHFLLASGSTREERFALVGDMPSDHSLFNDGPGQAHDSQMFVEIARHVGAFIGRRYFRVPLDRSCRFDSVEFALTTPAAWRVGAAPAHMAVDIHASPAEMISGVTGGLRLRGMMEIDGVASCTGNADLRFLPPNGPRPHRTAYRPWARTRGLGDGPPPVDPHMVGRCDPRNVVVSTPTGTDEALSTELLVDPGHPVFFCENSDVVPGILLVEAIRQTSMLVATRAHGFNARHTCVTRASVRFPGDALLDLPLTCTARVDPQPGDRDGTPTTVIRSTIAQLDQVIAAAELTLTHTS